MNEPLKIKRVSFELSWNDINTVIANYVKEKAELILDRETDISFQTFTAFCDKDGKQVSVETASVIVKSV